MSSSLLSHVGNYHLRTHRSSFCHPLLGQTLPSLHLCSQPEGQQTPCPGSSPGCDMAHWNMCQRTEMWSTWFVLYPGLQTTNQTGSFSHLKTCFPDFSPRCLKQVNSIPQPVTGYGENVCWSAADCKTGLFDSRSGEKKKKNQQKPGCMISEETQSCATRSELPAPCEHHTPCCSGARMDEWRWLSSRSQPVWWEPAPCFLRKKSKI